MDGYRNTGRATGDGNGKGTPGGRAGKVKVISYSMTGNNDAVAKLVASGLGAGHIRITEPKRRTMGTIAADMLFNRTPRINESLDAVRDGELVVFVGPVWMGGAAAPMRACFKHLRGRPVKYAFCSISGGADGPNPKLEGDLTKRMGKAPVALVDLHIAELLPREPKPTRDDTMAYRLTEADVKNIAAAMVEKLSETFQISILRYPESAIEGGVMA